MTREEVGRYAESPPRVKRKGTESRPAWYVDDRLVVRLHDSNTLVIRVPLSKREALLDEVVLVSSGAELLTVILTS
ncbi:MAG: hypothetical protein JWO76_2616 [Nocardioides sp.]|nr:hypothetical protein [Nocardioides sp.]